MTQGNKRLKIYLKDHLAVQVFDPGGLSSTATISIEVIDVIDPPKAVIIKKIRAKRGRVEREESRPEPPPQPAVRFEPKVDAIGTQHIQPTNNGIKLDLDMRLKPAIDNGKQGIEVEGPLILKQEKAG